jgi:hypothetical protein
VQSHKPTNHIDVSDAGLVYWVLPGAGNECAGVDDFYALLERPQISKPQ